MKLRLCVACICLAGLAGCAGQSAIDRLTRDTNAAARAAAASKLGTTQPDAPKAEQTIAALAAATADGDAAVRQAAIKSLSSIKHPAARQALLDVVRGRQYTRAAYNAYKAVANDYRDMPEVMAGLAKSEMDLGMYKEAEGSFDNMWRVLKNLDPQESSRYMTELQRGIQQLEMVLMTRRDQEALTRVQKLLAEVDAKMATMPPPSSNGMFGGGGFPMQ